MVNTKHSNVEMMVKAIWIANFGNTDKLIYINKYSFHCENCSKDVTKENVKFLKIL